MKMVETSKTNCADIDVAALIGSHPNTYTFTKQMAEQLLERETTTFPVAIVRPSIVLGTMKKPVDGWIDNVNNGACGFIAGCMKGVFRTVNAEPKMVTDMTPCDHVTNMCIAAAWNIGVEKPTHTDVYHCTSGENNPIIWSRYIDLVLSSVRTNPSDEILWYPNVKVRASVLRTNVVLFLFHILPAFFLSRLQKMGKDDGKPDLLWVAQKYKRGTTVMEFFTKKEFRFANTNCETLMSKMSPEDRDLYGFDSKTIDWALLVDSCVIGIRRYFFKESKVTGAKGKMAIRVRLVLHILFYMMLFAGFKFAVEKSLDFLDLPQFQIFALLFAALSTYFVHWL